MLDRTLAPSAHQIQGISLIAPEEHLLENGLRIFVFPSDDQDLVKAEFVFSNVFDEVENPLKNAAMSALLKEGTTSLTAAKLAEKIDYYGAYLIPEYALDHSALTLYTLSKYVDDVLPIVWDVLQNAAMPEGELQTYVRNHKQSLQISLEKNEFLGRRIFYQKLFGDNRYGQSLTISALDALDRDELLDLYKRQVRPDNCTLFLSGKVSADTLSEVIRYFGDQWQGSAPTPKFRAPDLVFFDKTMCYEERSASLQSAIRVGKKTITRKHEDFPALQFVNTLFGGYFGSRLMQNIREDKGYTYGIGSSLLSLKHVGMWTLHTQVGVHVTNATLHEIEKEIDALHQDLASEQEVELVRNYLLGTLLGSLESIFSHADKFKATYLSGMDLSYYEHYTHVIRTMDAAQVRDIAQRYLDVEDFLYVVVGKMESEVKSQKEEVRS